MRTQSRNGGLPHNTGRTNPAAKRPGTRITPERHGNRAWSQGILGPIQPTQTEFERVVARLRLQPDEYVGSQELREWAEKNKDARYIPERLLKAWRIPLRGSIEDIG